ncbi:unnamed protein product [Rotaria magnacalcarata]|uniref:Uncharacterized protein n=1 Tax=Rotaria magnacalcarata TaxID=392030 RepID=A0A820NAH8_9BILA|nr:unnamed protein product [Rotaria magnacalcarata]
MKDGQLLTSSSTNVTRHTHRLPSTTMGNNFDGEIISKVVRELETKVQELERNIFLCSNQIFILYSL